MSFTIKPATRVGIKPLVGFYGKSGSGKTYSALMFARGLVGRSGKIRLIDSESGRGSLFADIIPGGYDVIAIEPPFSPERYGEAFELADADSDCVIMDSLSHEWGGQGGILDMQEAELDRMAGDDWKKREACKMAAWIKPKLAHKHFRDRLLRSKSALICCLRAEEKTHMVTGENGKQKVITDGFSSPIYDPRFIFELTVNFETVAMNGEGGYVIPRKITHPAIKPLLPKPDEQIGIKHGELMAEWCKAGTAKATDTKDETWGPSMETKERNTRKIELWHLTRGEHGNEKDKFWSYLLEKRLITEEEMGEELSAERLQQIIEAVKKL